MREKGGGGGGLYFFVQSLFKISLAAYDKSTLAMPP